MSTEDGKYREEIYKLLERSRNKFGHSESKGYARRTWALKQASDAALNWVVLVNTQFIPEVVEECGKELERRYNHEETRS